MKKICIPFLIVLLAGLAGCDYGLAADEETSEVSPFVTPLVDREAIPALLPALPESGSAQEPRAGESDDEPAELDHASGVEGTCFDMSGGTPRPVPCLLPRKSTQPRSHDDPDPWKPVVLPTMNY